jgi:mono/diheme cytochrome c family protein
MMQRSSRLATGVAHSLPSMVRGTGRRLRRAVTTWCSLADGKASGDYVVFADGFAGAVEEPGQAAHRPSGLAVGADGVLYISDDQRGRIWRVTYRGPATAGVVAAQAPVARAGTSAAAAEPPEGIHPNAGAQAAAPLPTPPGATPAEVALGGRIFYGQVASAPCAGCHGADAKGTPLGPDLAGGKWLWGDGSLASISRTIADGVPKPKEYGPPMPPMGGAQLSQPELAAVAAYVWALGHQGGH